MAIAGTIELDEHFGDLRDDAQWESDEAEIDNLMDWWKSFGLGGYGKMEDEKDVREKDGSVTVPAPIPVPTVSDSSQEYRKPSRETVDRGDATCPQKRNWRTWTDVPPPPIPPPRIYHNIPHMTSWKPLPEPTDTSKILVNAPYNKIHPPQISTLGISPEPLRRPSLAESLLSLPPSPMLDLVVSCQSGKDEEVPIPMGFNLGHDLGDFLNWEARHVQSLYSQK